jgi:hypothetical protein
MLKGNMVICTSKKITTREELLWDYNCDCYCSGCEKWVQLYSLENEFTSVALNAGIIKVQRSGTENVMNIWAMLVTIITNTCF